jgi:rhodanese-related sulfurtransferase
VRRGSHALYFEPRLGKTKAALDAVGMLAAAGKLDKVLVLGPLRAMDVWDQQIRKHFPFRAECETTDEEWTINHRADGPTVQFYFLNYERARSRTRHGKRGTWRYPYLGEVEQWDPDLIVCDESHRLKRAGGVTAQAIWRMVRRLRKSRRHMGRRTVHVYHLSGTPNPKGWIDLFAQFRIMDETIFGTDKASFEEDHVLYGRGPMQYSIVKYRGVKSILRKVRAHSYTCTAEEAGLAGEQFWQDLPVTLPKKARLAYEEMAEEFITELESGVTISAANPAVKRLRLLQITGGFTTDGHEIHRAKLTVLKDYARDLLEQEDHVVVYCRFLPEVASAAESLEQIGYPVADLHGGTSRRGFNYAIRQFQASRNPRALVFQVQTGSLAIELSRSAEVVFYSPPDGWELYFQALSRVLGPNQKRPVRYTHIIAKHTLDSAVMAALADKEDIHRIMYKDPRRFLYGYREDSPDDLL